jgi:nitrite reductase/ring-hydroxylating ferredoxin subunit
VTETEEDAVLAPVEAVPNGGSAAFPAPWPDADHDVLVVRRGERIVAYVNRCPHLGTPLDLVPGRFLSRDRTHILCTTHGALFRIEDGGCVRGPCMGESLSPLRVRVQGGVIRVARRKA